MKDPAVIAQELMKRYSGDQEKQRRLCLDSQDWQDIPMLLGTATEVILTYPFADSMNYLRVAAQVIYTMGYDRGKREAILPNFVVGGNNG